MLDSSEGSEWKLIADVRSGQQAAAAKLFALFHGRLIADVRRKRIALRVIDPIASTGDAVNSAFNDLLEGIANGRILSERDDRRSLYALLRKIAEEKVIHQWRHQGAKKRDRHKLLSEMDRGGTNGDGPAMGLDGFPDDEPPPGTEAGFLEEISRIRLALNDELSCRVFDLMLEGYAQESKGYTDRVMAERLDCSDRTIRRKVELIKAVALKLEGR